MAKNPFDLKYREVIGRILENGKLCHTRSGSTLALIDEVSLSHDLADGFPLLTTRRLPWKGIRVELDGFLKGITNKQWYLDRGCHFWDAWARRDVVNATLAGIDQSNMTPEERVELQNKVQLEELDIFSGYFWELLHFGAEYLGHDADYTGKGLNQIEWALERLRTIPNCREVVMLGWNPTNFKKYAIPPCYYSWQVQVIDGRLCMNYAQRSADMAMGAPNDFALNAIFLVLMANSLGVRPGKLTVNYGNAHVYTNHVENMKELIAREPFAPPRLELSTDININNFEWELAELSGYEYHGKLDFAKNIGENT